MVTICGRRVGVHAGPRVAEGFLPGAEPVVHDAVRTLAFAAPVGKDVERPCVAEIVGAERDVARVAARRRTRAPQEPWADPPQVVDDGLVEVGAEVEHRARRFDPRGRGDPAGRAAESPATRRCAPVSRRRVARSVPPSLSLVSDRELAEHRAGHVAQHRHHVAERATAPRRSRCRAPRPCTIASATASGVVDSGAGVHARRSSSCARTRAARS